MSFEVVDLTERIGSEIRTDARTLLTPEVAGQVRRVLLERGVVVFKKIGLSDEQQVRLAGMIGTIRPEGENGIFKITLDNTANTNAAYLKGSFNWHMDGTHDSVPVFGSLLSGHVLSAEGGQTEFANSYAAYEELPAEKKEKLQGLRVLHSFAVSMERAGIEVTPETQAHWNSIPERTHSLVWSRETGRKSLVIGCHASHVVGMERDESDALLEELLAWATRPECVYRHEWDVGDLLIWNNTGVLHRVEPYPTGGGRMMHRTTLMGEEAFA